MPSHHAPSHPLPTTSLSPFLSPDHIPDDEKPSPGSVSPPPPPATRPVFLSREDCWSEDATRTLIDAWGSHYLQLNRGNLRLNHWQAVADAVNAIHATIPKLHRSDIQCKNRIDTIKKYKIEKSKTLQSDGRYLSTWPHFQTLDSLIGGSFSKHNHTTTANRPSRYPRCQISPLPESSPSPPHPSTALARDVKSSPGNLPRVQWSVPVGPRSKRSGYRNVTKRNFSVMAAAAAAMEAEEGGMSNDEYSGAWAGRLLDAVGRKTKRRVEKEGKSGGEGSYSRLAEAVARLGKIYEKVELEKQRQMVELEKQRMQFFKDLEIQRMKIFMESQVQLVKLKRAKHHSENRVNTQNLLISCFAIGATLESWK